MALWELEVEGRGKRGEPSAAGKKVTLQKKKKNQNKSLDYIGEDKPAPWAGGFSVGNLSQEDPNR